MSSPAPRASVRAALLERLRPLVVALAGLAIAAGGAGPVIGLTPATGGIALAPAPGAAALAPADAPAAPAHEPAGPASAAGTTAHGSLPVSLGWAVRSGPTVVAAPASASTGATPSGGPHTRVATSAATTPSGSGGAAYTGRNHVWIPALGIDQSVGSFPCSRSTAPANYVYRWGCAGANNVYLLGHAWGVFKPLHDAYANGRLKVGMKVVYADGSGAVHTYSVRFWRLVKPTTSASWAWAALPSPGMTLQTCMGANSEYRLMVRLTRID